MQLPPSRAPERPLRSLLPRAPIGALLLGALLPGACRTQAVEVLGAPLLPRSPGSGPQAQDGTAETAELRTRLAELLDEGDYAGARGLIDELLLGQHLELARAYLARMEPEDALVAVDRALELAPHHDEACWLKARGSLLLAQKGIDGGGGASLIEGSLQDALRFFELCSEQRPRAVFGASHAALLLGDAEQAVRWARAGRERLADDPDLARGVSPNPRRTIAEAFFRAYVEARGAEDAELAAVLYGETEEALGSLLGRDADSPWAWRTISDLYEWEQRYDLAHARLLDGLARVPGDPGLLERLARVVRRSGGREAVIAEFARIAAHEPKLTAGHWYLALERYELGLEAMNPPEGVASYDPELFRLAEAGFRRVRELDPRYERACLGYEAICRGARGWCAFYGADDLELAQREFLSMNDLFERGIEWSLEGRLSSGILGLAFVGDQYNNRQDWLRAGEAFELAHRFEPDEPMWANNAGFFLRDAGVELELEGRRLCRAARGEITEEAALAELRELASLPATVVGTPEEPLQLARAANDRMGHAREVMARSWRAYERAAELESEDVRTANDAALVLVYYLHENLDVAEQLLLRCIEMGPPQLEELRARLAAEDLADADREDLEGRLWELENALGDAYQNMGVLLWVHRGDGPGAIPYLERSVAIGPDPRPMLTNNLLPLVRGEREPTAGEYFDLASWGRPCR